MPNIVCYPKNEKEEMKVKEISKQLNGGNKISMWQWGLQEDSGPGKSKVNSRLEGRGGAHWQIR